MSSCSPTHIWKHSRGKCNRKIPDIDHSSQVQDSMEHATKAGAPNYDYSVPISVSSESEISMSSIYQYSREIAVQGTTRKYKSYSRISKQRSIDNKNTERLKHPKHEQCRSRVASNATWWQFELIDIATLVQAGFCKIGKRTTSESSEKVSKRTLQDSMERFCEQRRLQGNRRWNGHRGKSVFWIGTCETRLNSI